MKVKNHKQFAKFEYISGTSSKMKLGDIVLKDAKKEEDIEIGVIIQIHDENEYRTDMFGNCHIDELVMATKEDIKKYRPKLLKAIDNTKYVFINIKIRDGENEYRNLSVHYYKSEESVDEMAENYLKTFYGGDFEKIGDSYSFHNDTIICKLAEVREITKAEYDVLKNFM